MRLGINETTLASRVSRARRAGTAPAGGSDELERLRRADHGLRGPGTRTPGDPDRRHARFAEAAKARSGPSGLSAYVAAAVARQIERDNLNELIAVSEAEHGPVTGEEIQDLRDQLHQARDNQAAGGANAA